MVTATPPWTSYKIDHVRYTGNFIPLKSKEEKPENEPDTEPVPGKWLSDFRSAALPSLIFKILTIKT